MLHGASYYYRLNQPAKAMRLVLIALLVFLPFISGKGMVFSSVQNASVSIANTASSNTVPANTNSPTLEKEPLAQKVTKPEDMPEGLYAAWKQAQAQEVVSDNAYRLEATAAGEVQGRNPAQGLEFSFQSGGVNINGMNLALTGIGYQGQTLEPLAEVAPIASVGRVEYQRGTGLTEWYSNKAEGLEQGFTLTQAWPTGQPADSELALEMSLTGGLFHSAGDGLTLVSSEGSITRYGGLYAYDATGRALESRMEVGQDGQTARILVNLTGAQYPIVIDPLVQGSPSLTASDGASGDQFGYAVSLSSDGNTALIGVPWKTIGANYGQGAAYIFVRSGTTWVQQQILTDTTGAGSDWFGAAVSLSGDGNTALVGSWNKISGANYGQGATYVFVRSGTSWSQQQKLTASDGVVNDHFGLAVSLSNDGNTALISSNIAGNLGKGGSGGNTYQGAAYIFVRSGTSWTPQQKLTASDGAVGDNFGSAVSLSNDGNTALVGASYKTINGNTFQGAAYIFVRSGTTWTQKQRLIASDGAAGDGFGNAVSLSSDGNTALIGADQKTLMALSAPGAAYIFVRATNGNWSQQGAALTETTASINACFGRSVSLSSDGNTALIGAHGKTIGTNSQQGVAYTFVRSGTSWSQQQQLTASDGTASDFFGYAVSLSGDGNTVLVGAKGKTVGANTSQGVVYTFATQPTTTLAQQQLTVSDGAVGDLFGMSVSLSGDGNTALIGAWGKTIGSNTQQGAAYIFVRSGTSWSQQQRLTASDGAANDHFGVSVSLSSDGNTALIGADGKTIGANASQGTAYIFVRSGTTWSQQQRLTSSDGAASDSFGSRVSLSSDGNTALIGAWAKTIGTNTRQGAVYIFVRSGTTWTQQQQLTASNGTSFDLFGYAVSLSGDGNTALIGASYKTIGANSQQGAAYIFVRSGTTWSQQGAALTASDSADNDIFSKSVSLSSDGNTALVGACSKTIGANGQQGAAYIFVRSGTTWSQQQRLTTSDGAANDQLGFAVSLSSNGNTALIGSYKKTIGTNSQQGAAYIFVRSGITWSQQGVALTASNGAANDWFGNVVSLSGDGNIALIGASGKNNNQGAAYIFGSSTTTNTLNTLTTLTVNPASTSNYGQAVTLTATIAAAINISTITGHSSPVFSVAYSPDGKTLASGSYDNSIKLWEVSTGKLLNTITGHSNSVYSVAFSPDGKTLASGSFDNIIKLWEVSTGKLLNTLTGHSSGVALVVFSPDGKTLASGSFDKTIKLWEVSTGKLLNTLTGHSNSVRSVAFSPDGKTLASGSLDNSIKLWEVSTGKLLNTLIGHSLEVRSVAFSPDSKTLVSGSSDKTIKLWEVSTGKLLNTLIGHSLDVNSVAYSPDGKTIVSGSSDTIIKLWEVGTGNPTPLTNVTGTVDFKDGSTKLNTTPVAVTNGVATFTTSTLITGSHTLSAVYSGNSTYLGSTSSVVTYTVEGVLINPLIQRQQLTASDGAAKDLLGKSVSLSSDGNTALIGAPGKTIGANTSQGAAYIFVRSGTTWSQQQQLIASDGVISDTFGSAVSLSSDGNTALIGAWSKNNLQGAAYVFVRSGTTWSQQQILTASDGAAEDEFGIAVSLSGDGNTALIGAYDKTIGANTYQGVAYIFVRSGTSWIQQQRLTASDGTIADLFGFAVSLSSDGNTALIGAYDKTIGSNGDQGAAYVFTRSGTTWTQQQRLTASDGAAYDLFGIAVSLSSDGNTALIGFAPVFGNSQEVAYTFVRSGTTWSQQQKLSASDGSPGDHFGESVSLSGDGNTALIGAWGKTIGTNGDQGVAYTFVRSGTTWTQKQRLIASDGSVSDWFGDAVSLSGGGNTALIGAYGKNSAKGAAYIFASETTTTTTALSSSANPSTSGKSITFTATVTGTGGTPSGIVTFNTLGIATLSNGVATFSTSTLSGGTHSITAVYSGDAAFAGSTSAALTQVVSGGSGSLVYYPLPKPIRVLDTRAGQTALYNGSNGYPKFTAGQTVTYTLAGITYGGYSIPAEAQVVVATLAAIQPTGQGFLTIYPSAAGAALPTISSLSYRDAADTGVTSNTSYLNLGTGGVVNVYSKNATDLVIDISGYYAPAGTTDPNNVSTGLLYFPLPQPIRLLDTRAGATAKISGDSFSAGNTKSYTLNNIGYNGGITGTTPITIPAAAKALVANTTVVGAVGQGYLTLYPGPTGSTLPTISSMNYRNASNTSSSSYPTLDGSGVINVYSLRAADVVLDVSGYFAPVGTVDPNISGNTGLYYNPLPQPIRVLDTRANSTALYSGGGQFSAGGIRSYNLTNITYPPTGGYNIPATAKALVANTTVVGPAGQGFLILYPGPASATIPLVSSLNYRLGTASATTSNPSHVTVSSLGVANVYSLRATDIVMDVSGYYVP